jgi:hypothetical protein
MTLVVICRITRLRCLLPRLVIFPFRSQGMKAFSNAETFVMKNIRETIQNKKLTYDGILNITEALQEGKVTEDELLNFIKTKK